MIIKETTLSKPIVEETDRTKLPETVLCRVKYNICNIDERNANGRIYEKSVWENVLQNETLQEMLQNRRLFGQAEHPVETQSDLQLTSHVVHEMWIDEDTNNVWQTIDVLDTPMGRIVDSLIRAGCGVGVSTRAEGDLEESEDDQGKFSRVVPEAYRYITTDFTADPSTFNVLPQDIQKNVVSTVQNEMQNKKATAQERRFATQLFESLSGKKEDTEELKLTEGQKVSYEGKDYVVKKVDEAANAITLRPDVQGRSVEIEQDEVVITGSPVVSVNNQGTVTILPAEPEMGPETALAEEPMLDVDSEPSEEEFEPEVEEKRDKDKDKKTDEGMDQSVARREELLTKREAGTCTEEEKEELASIEKELKDKDVDVEEKKANEAKLSEEDWNKLEESKLNEISINEPAGFKKCVDKGGRVRTVSGEKEHGLGEDEYVKYCFLDGSSYRGEVHKKENEAKVDEDFKGYEYDEKIQTSVVVPSFTFDATVRVSKVIYDEEGRGPLIKQPVKVQIESFEHNIEEVLDEVVPKALAETLQGKIPDSLSPEDVYVGGHTSAFPHSMHFWTSSEKNVSNDSTTRESTDLRIKEATTRAEKEKALEVIEELSEKFSNLKNQTSESKMKFNMLMKKLKEAASVYDEVNALRTKLEEKAKLASTSEKALEEAKAKLLETMDKRKADIAELAESHKQSVETIKKVTENKVKELKESYDKKVKEGKEQGLKEGISKILKEYFACRLAELDLSIGQNTRALLESCESIEEVEDILEKTKDIRRRNALHSESITEFHIDRNQQTDPEQARIKKEVGKVMDSM